MHGLALHVHVYVRVYCMCMCTALHAPPNPNVRHPPPSPPPSPSSTSHLGQIGYIGFDFSIYDHLHYFKEVIGDGACFRAERDAARGAKQNGRGPAGG